VTDFQQTVSQHYWRKFGTQIQPESRNGGSTPKPPLTGLWQGLG
jgi:hypothetical protein